MKKLKLIFLIAMAIFFVAQSKATQVPNYIVNQDFTGLAAYPSGWSTASTALYAASGAATIANNNLTISGSSGSGGRGLTVNFPTSGSEPTVYLDFDWTITSAVTGQRNALGMMINDANGKPVLCLYAAGSDAKFHYWNQNKDTVAFIAGSFNKASGTSITGTNILNITTAINFTYAIGITYNVKATLDFTNHNVVSLIITNKSNSTSVTVENKPFIDLTATDISKISISNTRSSIAGNGAGTNFTNSIDNFKVYKLVDAPTANVTVKYLDPSNTEFKTARLDPDQIIGGTYSALFTDKATYTDGSFYYTYDGSATASYAGVGTGDTVVVKAGGSIVNLKFAKTPVTAGIYSWTGLNSGIWDDVATNFTTDASNSISYQSGNEVAFTSTPSQKTISLVGSLNLVDKNMTISGAGYNFSGTGSITSSGSLNINLSGSDALNLSMNNSISGITNISGGEITVSKVGAIGSNVNVTGATTLKPSVALPAISFSGSSSILPSVSSSIAGIAATAGTKVTISSAVATVNSASAYLITPTGVLNGELELNGTAASETRFGLTAATTSYLGAAKVTLKGTAFLYVDGTPLASTTMNIGTLSGESTTRLGWCRSSDLNRNITWSVGALNENSEYAGTITNLGGYNGGGNFFTGAYTHFIKEGTATLTLSGIVNAHNGDFTVNTGKLNVTGNICKSTSMTTVGANGTLLGNGTVGGATTVNGTLEGSLHFGSSLTLAGTTNLTVNGFGFGQYDSISVVGAVTNGGVLNITVNASAPADGTSIKLIKAGSYTNLFTTVNAPQGYNFDATTGILTYSNTPTQLKETQTSLNAYVSQRTLVVTGVDAYDVFDIQGLKIATVSNTTSKVILQPGVYFVKAANKTVKVFVK